jgi:hypothetical protein
MNWEPRHERLYKDGVLIRHKIQRTPDGEWEDYVEEKVELPKQSMRMKAFPTLKDNGHITTQDGMDLRDYFAAKIMQSLVIRFNDDEGIADWNAFEEADIAYQIADAMMKARESD